MHEPCMKVDHTNEKTRQFFIRHNRKNCLGLAIENLGTIFLDKAISNLSQGLRQERCQVCFHLHQ